MHHTESEKQNGFINQNSKYENILKVIIFIISLVENPKLNHCNSVTICILLLYFLFSIVNILKTGSHCSQEVKNPCSKPKGYRQTSFG